MRSIEIAGTFWFISDVFFSVKVECLIISFFCLSKIIRDLHKRKSNMWSSWKPTNRYGWNCCLTAGVTFLSQAIGQSLPRLWFFKSAIRRNGSPFVLRSLVLKVHMHKTLQFVFQIFFESFYNRQGQGPKLLKFI